MHSHMLEVESTTRSLGPNTSMEVIVFTV